MKKKTLLIILIILLFILVGFFIVKNAFVTANDEMPNAETATVEEIKEYGEKHIDITGEVKKLTESEKELLASVYKFGDITQDGYITEKDAEAALDIYTKTQVSHKRDYQTVAEIYTGDVDENGIVSVEDAQILLCYYVESVAKGPKINDLKDYVANFSNRNN